mmetsp:Transcript_81386/g.256642  ORF Transcript_81386/g.256642 Transcript_81386/m.256642 type:complete len:232 (+) Transcript_81386:64-759(+)
MPSSVANSLRMYPAATSSLVAAGLPAAARLLELPALGTHKRLRVAVRHAGRLAEVLLGLAGLHRAAQEHRALSKRRAERKLVEGEALAAGVDDAGTCSLGEVEGANAHLGHLIDALVIRDRAHHTCDLTLFLGHVLDELREREGRPVLPCHVQPLGDDLVEPGVRAAGHELVELAQEPEVRVRALNLARADLLAAACLDVDAHLESGEVLGGSAGASGASAVEPNPQSQMA